MSCRRVILASASITALLLSSGFAFGAEVDSSETVVVTGSRISGYQAPTPTLVTSASDLQLTSPASLSQGLAKLPQFAGSVSQAGSGGGGLGSGGVNQVGSFLNLRRFGSIRTLVLLDGRRVPATNFDGNVDVDSMPQALVQRVDVVTGGASAVYGSDAVTGVVNYVLDHNFTGLKGLVQSGISGYGDDLQVRANVAFGADLFGGKGHFIGSAEIANSNGVKTKESRPWYNDQLITGAGTVTNPYRLIQQGRQTVATYGGLVTTGPFKGQMFNPNGTLSPFDPGVPSGTSGLNSGGDGSYHVNTSMVASLRTEQGFGRFQYNFSDHISGFLQASFSEQQTTHTQATPNRTNTGPSPIVILSGNPYLTADQQATLTATNTPSFTVSEYGLGLGRPFFVILTTSKTATAGLEGDVFGDFHWDFAFTHGEGRTEQQQRNNSNNQHFYAALDAVKDTSGNIVCRVSITNPGLYPGCVPINVLGLGNASQAAINYTTNTTGWTAVNTSDDAVANITGNLFEGWAGPISAAWGAEYRAQSLNQTTTADPTIPPTFTGIRPDGYSASTLSYVGVLVAASKGSNHVWETNAETVVPLLKDAPLAQSLEFNGAIRYTDYSNSGGVVTYKLGLNYQPVQDLRFRFVKSRDIREPTLYDLYAAQAFRNTGLVDPLTGLSSTARQVSGGNPGLVPEVANTWTAGFVYSPEWFPGFDMSLDYYNIEIKNAIGTVATDTAIRQCTASGGSSPLCQTVTRPINYTDTSVANYPTAFYTTAFNIAQTFTAGADLETSYRTDLADWSDDLAGSLNLRLLGSYQPVLKSQNYLGAGFLNSAGVAGLSSLRATFQVSYKDGPFSLTALDRWNNGGVWNSDRRLIYAEPNFGSYNLVDLDLAYDWLIHDVGAQTFIAVNNLFNKNPQIMGTDSPGQVTGVVAGNDVIGRYFTVGIRFKY